MIRESIESGTRVWSSIYGFGYFKGWTHSGLAIINFGGFDQELTRKDLTEVEDK